MNGSGIKLPAEYELENGHFNRMNAEYLTLVGQLENAKDEDFVPVFGDFVQHTENQFAEKSDWMKASRFPLFQQCTSEQAKVLSSLKSMLKQADKGQLTFARSWIKEQAIDWFVNHLMSMDKALSNHLQSLGSGRTAKQVRQASKRIVV